MLEKILSAELRRSQEFQSGMVRLLVWVLMVVLLGLAGTYGIYEFDWELFGTLFAVHLAWYLAIQVHVIYKPELIRGRTYLGVVADMSGTSLCIFLSGNPISPFALLYVLSYLSQGTRFGRNNLMVTSLASVIAFSIVSAELDGWNHSPVELVFMLLFMITLPLYQYALLNKLQAAKQAAEAAEAAHGLQYQLGLVAPEQRGGARRLLPAHLAQGRHGGQGHRRLVAEGRVQHRPGRVVMGRVR